ncbi:hypothetical protein [Staphylococcus phage vB_SauM-V1SA19]|nr:hypothetical protein [Staphylococcus phage vB_SauM-V1SA19]
MYLHNTLLLKTYLNVFRKFLLSLWLVVFTTRSKNHSQSVNSDVAHRIYM